MEFLLGLLIGFIGGFYLGYEKQDVIAMKLDMLKMKVKDWLNKWLK